VVVYLDSIDERLLDELTRMTGCTAPLFPSLGDRGRAPSINIDSGHSASNARLEWSPARVTEVGPTGATTSQTGNRSGCENVRSTYRRLLHSNYHLDISVRCPPRVTNRPLVLGSTYLVGSGAGDLSLCRPVPVYVYRIPECLRLRPHQEPTCSLGTRRDTSRRCGA